MKIICPEKWDEQLLSMLQDGIKEGFLQNLELRYARNDSNTLLKEMMREGNNRMAIAQLAPFQAYGVGIPALLLFEGERYSFVMN